MGIPGTTGGAPAGGGQLAEPLTRLWAYLIDVGIIIAVYIVLGIVFGLVGWLLTKAHLGFVASLLSILASLIGLAASVGLFLYLPAFDNPYTQRGQTMGKKYMGIKIVKDDGSEFGLVDVLLRNVVGYWVSAVVVYLGFIWIFIDAEHRGWHDKIAKTKVVVA
jgi:uncharacterized RDD family membrane protein YckC